MIAAVVVGGGAECAVQEQGPGVSARVLWGRSKGQVVATNVEVWKPGSAANDGAARLGAVTALNLEREVERATTDGASQGRGVGKSHWSKVLFSMQYASASPYGNSELEP